MRRIFDEYGLTKVMPLYMSHCGSAEGSMLFMVGMAKFVKALTKDPELCKRSSAIHNELAIRFGKAVREVGRPDMCLMAIGPDLLPLKGNEWLIPLHVELSKALTPSAPIIIGPSSIQILEWLARYYEKVGSDGYAGGFYIHDIDITKVLPFSREHDLYASCSFPDKVLLDGPISAIEEEIRVRCEYGKSYPKFVIGMECDYWTPQAHYDAAVAACKKYGK